MGRYVNKVKKILGKGMTFLRHFGGEGDLEARLGDILVVGHLSINQGANTERCELLKTAD